ncbi:MAG: diaminopimelate epimerase [Saprospiraceae bacterium]|jgi:diaminopimelate epimerase|nr:diaminopimelate epimerase [Saprospiraceae bacterium]
MEMHFHKYQGTGNDFIMVDNRASFQINPGDEALIALLCDRRFGIGGDGLILLESSDNADFKMIYFNSDGRQGSMCGNGGRCIVAFAYALGFIKSETIFDAIDGLHRGKVLPDGKVSIQMSDVNNISVIDDLKYELDTGSPHFVHFIDNLPADIKKDGAAVRYNDRYKAIGINVNFVVVTGNVTLEIATYERGVEDETYSCGTGVTAAALSYSHIKGFFGEKTIFLSVKGGNLEVSFNRIGNHEFTNIWLTGPAQKVFEGTYEIF